MKISNLTTYIKAVVEVEAEGYFVERLINLCKINNIKIWNIKYITSGIIRFSISPKEFKKLKPFIKKSKCKIKIINKKGMYFNLFKYRKRRIFFFLILGLLIVSIAVSSFVWKINIVTDEGIDITNVRGLLNEIDIHEGKNKLFISKGKIADYIRANMYEAAWVGVNISGTNMEIIVKAKIIPETVDNSSIGNIIAKKSAVITKIIAENGTAKYKTGSYIEKGSVAIEGVLNSQFIEPIKVHASGIVRGIVSYTFEREYKYNETVKKYTGKSRHSVGFGINDKKFSIKYLPKENKYDINRNAKIFEIFSVKFSIFLNTYDEYILEDIVNTKDELIEKGKKDSTLYFEDIVNEDSNIVDENVDVIELNDGIIYKVVLNVDEQIGEFVKTGE